MGRPAPDAFDAGMRALARRELSAAELIERITRSGVDRDEAVRVADELREAGYQSDERAACERARVLVSRGLADRAIDADLRQRGVPQTARASAIAELPPERERAERLVERRGSGEDTIRLLLRKGYDEDLARAVSGHAVADGP